MSEIQQNTVLKSSEEIQITGLNADKTRKINRSDNSYNVYFELSGVPSQVWKIIFERNWKATISESHLNGGTAEAIIDRGFLAIHCPLQEVATLHLPLLKQTVVATNKEYTQYIQQQEVEHMRRETIWKEERKEVYKMAEALHF